MPPSVPLREGQITVNKTSAFLNSVFALAAMGAAAFFASPLNAQSADDFHFVPNTLVLMRSVYAGDASTVTVGETLPPNCVNGNVPVPIIGGGSVSVDVSCGVATADGTFPGVFNNA